MNQYPGLYNQPQGNMGVPFMNAGIPQQQFVSPYQVAQNMMGISPMQQPLMQMNPGNQALYPSAFGGLPYAAPAVPSNPICEMLMHIRQVELQEEARQQQLQQLQLQQQQQQQQQQKQQEQQWYQQYQKYQEECQHYMEQLQQQMQPQPQHVPTTPAADAPHFSPTTHPYRRSFAPDQRSPCYLRGLFDKEQNLLREYQRLGHFWVWREAKSGSHFQSFSIENQKLILKKAADPIEKNRIALNKEKTLKGNIVLNLNDLSGVSAYTSFGKTRMIELEIMYKSFEDANSEIRFEKKR